MPNAIHEKGVRDYFCLEIAPPVLRLGDFSFHVTITKKAGAKQGNFLVTTPEFRNFMNHSPEGKKLQGVLDKFPGRGLTVGHVTAYLMGNEIVYRSFYPVGRDQIFYGQNFDFRELWRGWRIGSTVESRLMVYFKKLPVKYLNYGSSLTGTRDNQIKSRRGGGDSNVSGELENEHKLLKAELKRHASQRHYTTTWKRRAKLNKRKRLAR